MVKNKHKHTRTKGQYRARGMRTHHITLARLLTHAHRPSFFLLFFLLFWGSKCQSKSGCCGWLGTLDMVTSAHNFFSFLLPRRKSSVSTSSSTPRQLNSTQTLNPLFSWSSPFPHIFSLFSCYPFSLLEVLVWVGKEKVRRFGILLTEGGAWARFLLHFMD